MSTYTINTNESSDAAPSTLEKLKGNVVSFASTAAKFLLVAIVLLAEFFSVPKLSDTHATQSDIRQEMDSLIQSGYSRELEFDLDTDLDLYNTMMTIVRTMKYGDFRLEGSKAQEFWTAYAPAKADTTLEYIRFDSDDRHVLLRYSNGIAADVTMEFDTNYLYKATTLRYGVFNGSILRWLYWNLIGRFVKGYPCYVTEAALSGNGIRGDVALRKYTIRNQVFSWSFNPGKRNQIENVSEHWT
ncbi:MAG: hypothetical protein IKR84_07525 [Oscillibacter sp.]|nr:hypothetical protein [Oscillibacter sp.]